VAENFGLRRIAHGHLMRLAADTGQTAIMAMPAGAEVIVVDSVESTDHITITVRPGVVIPASTSALGRVILAFASPELRDAALATPASRLTEKTMVDPADVQSHLEFARSYW